MSAVPWCIAFRTMCSALNRASSYASTSRPASYARIKCVMIILSVEMVAGPRFERGTEGYEPTGLPISLSRNRIWYPERDSNPHSFRKGILSPLCTTDFTTGAKLGAGHRIRTCGGVSPAAYKAAAIDHSANPAKLASPFFASRCVRLTETFTGDPIKGLA